MRVSPQSRPIDVNREPEFSNRSLRQKWKREANSLPCAHGRRSRAPSSSSTSRLPARPTLMKQRGQAIELLARTGSR